MSKKTGEWPKKTDAQSKKTTFAPEFNCGIIVLETLSWSNQKNASIRDAVRIPELTGYIKDVAWSYEKELRIKAEFET